LRSAGASGIAQVTGNYLDISFTGDGQTPSNLERLGKNIQRSAMEEPE
jgi:hypothetical protein